MVLPNQPSRYLKKYAQSGLHVFTLKKSDMSALKKRVFATKVDLQGQYEHRSRHAASHARLDS